MSHHIMSLSSKCNKDIRTKQPLHCLKLNQVCPCKIYRNSFPYLDVEEILRVGGRMDYCDNLTQKENHPAFLRFGWRLKERKLNSQSPSSLRLIQVRWFDLPQTQPIVKLFVLNKNGKLGHRATETVLASLSQDDGVQPLGGIRTVRRYATDCFGCKLQRKSRAQQLMAPLSQFRVKQNNQF